LTPLPQPTPTPFPYTTLFRSVSRGGRRREPGLAEVDGVFDQKPVPAAVALPVDARRGAAEIADGVSRGGRRSGKCCRREFRQQVDRKSTRLNSSHRTISYAVF